MTEYRYQAGEQTVVVNVERSGDGFVVRINERTYHLHLRHMHRNQQTNAVITFTANDLHHPVQANVITDNSERQVVIGGEVLTLSRIEDKPGTKRHLTDAGDGNVAAAMPGQVAKLLVAEGDRVTRGQLLVLLEAMKMEIRVTAPRDGQISRVLVAPGQLVDRGQPLLELTTATDTNSAPHKAPSKDA